LAEGDGQRFGVAMPIIAYFSVAPTDASVFDKVATVTVNGVLAHGAWYWERSSQTADALEAHYRLASYWPAHATIHVNMPIAGLWAGRGLVFANNLTLTMRTGAAQIVKIDGKPGVDKMYVYQDGVHIRTFNISLGAAKTPTYLGTAVVISKAGKWFGPEEAADYIGGFVIFNDITARDIQRREMRSGVFSFCKGIDTFCPLGPWIVTPDEVGDPHDLQMTLRVNGESRQESHSGNMSVTIPEILSHYSALGYSAGDVVSTGTVSGVAGFSEDAASLYLKQGDVIEAEIEKIGILRNPVISWQDAHGEPAPPRVAL